jgi:excinuclease ABC subunit C
MQSKLYEKWKRVSDQSGVYVMKDSEGSVIYIGKALNLKKRMASYFSRSSQTDKKTSVLVDRISEFETIVTESEKEALILESNLIKRFRPRYNVILKDGKRYPSICINVDSPYPFLSIVRKIENNTSLYFGPYSSSNAVSQTIKLINKTFKLRKCKTLELKKKSRPCLNYQMNVCLAPCCHDVPQKAYYKMVKEVVLFLNGKTPNLIKQIKKEMMRVSDRREYERAALLRDKIFALEKTLEKQIIVSTDFKDRDVISIAESPELSILTLMIVRGGYLIGTNHFKIPITMASGEEKIETFIREYYGKNRFVPKEIFVPDSLENIKTVEEWLKEIKGEKVSIVSPKRGNKAKLLKMALMNAEKELSDRITSQNSRNELLLRLQHKLKLKRALNRIECFDNSNISGTSPVAGMVTFSNGLSDKSSYRRFKIKSVYGPDDYASMKEVLERRFSKEKDALPDPDLLMVDGGKGQLGIAMSVLKELGMENKFALIGIAKKDVVKGEKSDKIYRPGRANPINITRDEDILLFLQQIRDEAHRFAISFHREQRKKNLLRSELDGIPGIGPKRKKTLLTYFKSVHKIRTAEISDLVALPGINEKAALAVLEYLNKKTEK